MKQIVVVPYNAGWPSQFAWERKLLATVFGDTPTVIEHVGSTAVPGLGGKPIIDIMIGVSTLSAVERHIADLEASGYQYVPEYETELPDRRYFRRPPIPPRSHHLHCVVRGCEFWRSHLAFRDYLRANKTAATRYFELKNQLARRYRSDGVAYTKAKSGFIESIVGKALSDCGIRGRDEPRC